MVQDSFLKHSGFRVQRISADGACGWKLYDIFGGTERALRITSYDWGFLIVRKWHTTFNLELATKSPVVPITGGSELLGARGEIIKRRAPP